MPAHAPAPAAEPELDVEVDVDEPSESSGDWLTHLLGTFPVLADLRAQISSREIPFREGLAASECGAACLAMVVGYHGRPVNTHEVRQVLDVRQGSSATQILAAAEHFGLTGHGVALSVDELPLLDTASILHWEFNHFVVFERATKSMVTVLDPTIGRREVPIEQFRKSFTGVALVFEPGAQFEAGEKQVGYFRRFLLDVLSDYGLVSRILVTSLLLQIFSLALPFLTSAVVENIIPRADEHLLLIVSVGLGVVTTCFLIATVIRGLLLVFWRTRLNTRLTTSLLTHLLSLPYEYFQQRFTNELTLRLNSANVLRDGLTSGVVSALLDGTLVISYAGLVLWISPSMGLIVLLLALIQVAIVVLTYRRQRLTSAEAIAAGDKAFAAAYDIIGAVETLKSQGLERRVLQQWVRLFVDSENAQIKKAQLGVWVDSLSGTVRTASPLIVLVLGADKVMSGAMSLGTMLALNAVALGLFVPLGNLVQTALQVNVLRTHADRLEDLFQSEPEPKGTGGYKQSLSGGLRLQSVSFRYSALAPFAIQDVSLDCKPGELVALVGKSGCGKSTLAKLIAGLYRPTSGEILYDGHSIDEWGLDTVRAQLGYVAQQPRFLNYSIRDNIASFDPSIALERIEAAAKAAAVHDDIRAMPMGYQTRLFNDAGSVSGGQRQRIAIARALLNSPKVLILDEATSALDALAEQRVFHFLAHIRCTRVVVAHRLSTIAQAHRIVVVDGGRVVDQGTHADLMARCKPYQELVSAQVKG